MKHANKVAAALRARENLLPKDNGGLHFIKPGSQNKKKGYKAGYTK